MFGFLKKLFGSKYDRDIKAIMPAVERTKAEFAKLSALSHDALRHKTLEFRERIKAHLKDIDAQIAELNAKAAATEDVLKKQDVFDEVDRLKKERDKEIEVVLEDILPEAFAVVKETSRRLAENEVLEVEATDFDRALVAKLGDKAPLSLEGDKALWRNTWEAAGAPIKWNMVHYDVQLIGGVVLHRGKIAEMATGEGKTLVSTLPSYLNALAGEGVHLVTVNDYLAKRDSEWMGPLFNFLFLTVDCIDKYRPHSPERRAAYRADITYGTNNEFGFDYLRDNMVHSADEIVQRKFHYAMVDEVDSVLIDDARTPLIISGPTPADNSIELFKALKSPVERLVEAQRKIVSDYLREAKTKIAAGDTGVEEGQGGLALYRAYRGLPKNRALIKFLSEPGIQTVLRNTENHYLQENAKYRPQADKPLLFVIEEKNRSVDLTDKGSEFLGKGSNDANLFVMDDLGSIFVDIDKSKLSLEEKTKAKDEALREFTIKSERLHALQQLVKAYTLFEKEDEYVVMDGKVKIVDEQTGRIMEGRRYSDGLHQAIEAKENVRIEEPTQTYATVTLQNFFRMYHKLAGMTGTAETEAQELWDIYKLDVVVIPTNRPIIRDDRQDLVYKTDKEKFNAIIEEVTELVNKGRPVLVGTTSVQQSELLSRMLNMRGVKHNVLNAKQHAREAEIVAEAGQKGQVTIATNMAGRGTDIKISEEVRAAGGLAIVGTERHDSRRVDRQLRGRAGRQGDVGSSQFYISLEDRLMRLFGSERISKMMDKMGHKEGEVLQHGMITKSIERAQRKVEENNFGVRKRLLEYDEAMNSQRNAIYRRRNNALYGERLKPDLSDAFYATGVNILQAYKSSGNYQAFEEDCIRYFALQAPYSAEELQKRKPEELYEDFYDKVMLVYKAKFEQLTGMLLPIMERVLNDPNANFTRIAIPYTNGVHGWEISADMKEALETKGENVIREIERGVTLGLIDLYWKEHLRNMDELKDRVQNVSFEQKDPLVVYKLEARKLFDNFMRRLNRDITALLFRGVVPMRPPQEAQEVNSDFEVEVEELDGGDPAAAAEAQRRAKEEEARRQQQQQRRPPIAPPQRQMPEVGRNDLCPCGSGKKYKHCHGK